MPLEKDGRPSPFGNLRRQHLKNLSLDELYERLEALEEDERQEIEDVIAKFQREKEMLLAGASVPSGLGGVPNRGESRRGSNS
ncbi:hypothetical protein BDR26DRAFT_935755 [Obelidium mucronatum]|nr:hypothetical protein BDR26DRAFT_1014847 [Obelidium mucronatum]KAI9337321.1 hypothetical protein BDR26DRAFT_935755 [Obelidium mucronatum]